MRANAAVLVGIALLVASCGGSDDSAASASSGSPNTSPSPIPSSPPSSPSSSPPLDEGELQTPETPAGVEFGAPMTSPNSQVRSLRFAEIDGEPLAVSGSSDGNIRVWNLRTREQHTDLIDTEYSVVSLSLGELDGVPLVASVGYNAPVAEVRGLFTGEELVDFDVSLGSFPLTVAADGSVLVVGNSDDSVQIYDGGADEEPGTTVGEHGHSVHGSAFADVDGERVAITTGDDENLILWDPRERTRIGDPIKTWHREWVRAVAAGDVDGTPVAVTGSHDYDLRVFDLTERRQIGDPLVGHTDAVTSVDVGVVNGVPIAISGSRDRTVRAWNLRTMRQIGDPFITHLGKVGGVALGEIDGQSIALSGGEHGAVQVWDLSAITDET